MKFLGPARPLEATPELDHCVRCRGCGRLYAPTQWEGLEFVGIELVEGVTASVRKCSCHQALAVPVKVQKERARYLRFEEVDVGQRVAK